jgi:DNA replication protein DnaC
MNNEQRRNEENLILLCHAHHKITDNVDEYTVEKLKAIKAKHESKFVSGGDSINLTDEKYSEIVFKYEEEFKRLYEIITKLGHFRKPEKEFKAFKANYRPSIQQFEDNLNYFDTQEQKVVTQFAENFNSQKVKTALILGLPSSGKTTLALGISRELYKHDFEVHYVELNHTLSSREIIQELVIINKKKSLIIVDDIHKNLSLAIDIYLELEDMQNISALFLSRKLSEDFQKDDSGINLFDEITTSHELVLSNPTDKFQGIIQSFQTHFSITQSIGDINKVLKLANHNILKLNLLLTFWKDNQDKKLDQLTEQDFNRELFIRYLQKIEGNIQDIIPYCCINSYGIDFHFLQDRTLCDKLQLAGLIYESDTKNKLFSFGHSQFAELLLESIIEKLPQFDSAKYKQQANEIKTLELLKYFKQFSSSSQFAIEYPKNTAAIFAALHQQKIKGAILTLLNDKTISDKTLKYLQSEEIELSAIKDFFKALRFCYKAKFEYFTKEFLEKSAKFKETILNDRDGFTTFSFLLICCYKCNLSKQASKLISLLTKEELKQLIQNSPVNSTTHSARLFKNYNPPFCKLIIESLSESDWADSLMKAPPFITANSLTEFKEINRTMTRNIFLLMNEEDLGNKLSRLKYFYFEKAISELKEVDPDKAKRLFEYYNDEKILIGLSKCKSAQLGKGLASLFLVNPDRVSKIYSQLNSNDVADQLKLETVKNAMRIIAELFKISETKTTEILQAYISDFSLSHIKDIADYFTLVHTLTNVAFADRQEIFSKFSTEKLLPLFRKATAENYSSGLSATKLYNHDLAKAIYADTEINLNGNDIGFSSLGNILLKLKLVDPIRSKEVLRKCDRKILIRKATANDINFGQIIKSIEEIKALDPSQAIEIFNLVSQEAKYQAKIYKLSFDLLLHTIVSIYKISPDIAKETFKTYTSQHKHDLNSQNISFQNLAQGLGKLSKISKPLCNQILDRFFNKLKDQLPGLKFHELATGLSEVAEFAPDKAKLMLDSCSTEMLVSKAKDTKAVTLNSAMGEIKKFDTIRWAEITKQLK